MAFSEMVAFTPRVLKLMSAIHPGFVWDPWVHTYASVSTQGTKCIERSDGNLELYALPGDALETDDRAGERPDEAAALCARIDAWRSTFSA